MNAALLRAAAVELRTGVGYYDGPSGPLASLLDEVAARLEAGTNAGGYRPFALAGQVAEWIVVDDVERAS